MTNRFLLNLIKSTLTKSEPEWQEYNEEELFKTACVQQVHLLAYPALSKLEEDERPSPALMQKWKNLFTITSFNFANFFNFITHILNKLEEKGLPVLLLKGSVYRELYPSPELRTMGDVDLLMRPQDMDEFGKIIAEFGYTLEDSKHSGEFDRKYHAKGKPCIEVFATLEEDFGKNYTDKYEKNLLPYRNYNYVKRLAVLPSIVHHVAHFAKHFYGHGAGCRFLADLYVLLTKTEFDFSALIEEIKSIGCYKFFLTSIAVLEKYFGYVPPISLPPVEEKLREQFLDYILRYGIYGDLESSSIVKSKMRKKGGKLKLIFSALFPAPSIIKGKYAFVRKCPILLPIGWFKWIFDILAHPKRIAKNISYISGDAGSDIKLYKALED